MKLEGKIIITGKIVAKTGLHVGGSKSSLDIGGVDLNVVKTPKGQPFIPGSSLKGKLRSLLARAVGSLAVTAKEAKGSRSDEDFPFILQLFGSSGDDNQKGEVTRLIVRDANLDGGHFEQHFGGLEMELEYTDVKWENTIDRKRGTALHPRQLERVPADARFDFEIIYDLYSDRNEDYLDKDKQPEAAAGKNVTRLQKHLWALRSAMELLEDDYLGGQGSRGYGKVAFEGVQVVQKMIGDSFEYSAVEELDEDVHAFQAHFA